MIFRSIDVKEVAGCLGGAMCQNMMLSSNCLPQAILTSRCSSQARPGLNIDN